MSRGLPLTSCLDSCLTSIREMLVIFTGASAEYLRHGHATLTLPSGLSHSYSIFLVHPIFWFPLQRNFLSAIPGYYFFLVINYISCFSPNFSQEKTPWRFHSDYKLLQPRSLATCEQMSEYTVRCGYFVLKSTRNFRIRSSRSSNLGAYS